MSLQVHAPVNGTEAFADGNPDENFSFSISNNKGYEADVTDFFKVAPAELEKWDFSWFEDLYARDAKTPSVVNVAAKAYRGLSLYEPGDYTATLKYWDQTTVAHWTVHPPAQKRTVKNVILFIGDGMPQSAITAARLLGHKMINGKYQSKLQLDQMDGLGLQMTHSLDSFITDSANSATAILSGHKATVNALNVYVDSSPDAFDDPKVETFAELFHRQKGGKIGIVSTAYLADATPASNVAHTRQRGEYPAIVEQFLTGVTSNYSSWDQWSGPEVLFGGGAEQWLPGPGSPGGRNYYDDWTNAGYQLVHDKDSLASADPSQRTLGLFCQSNMAKWVDRKIFPENLGNITESPTGEGTAENQPGLAEMTLKAIDILKARSGDEGFFLMSEAASIDKMFHVMDYERALGELLELDDTVRQTVAHLEQIGELDETLIIVTADHAHGFDVFGSSDTKYLKEQESDRKKRDAIGTYANSGHSEYQVAKGSRPDNATIVYGDQGPNFPVQWDPRYAIAAGFGAHPDVQETYDISKHGPRLPAVNPKGSSDGYVANPKDQPEGFTVNGTIGTDEAQGVHSLQDVPVYTKGKPEAVKIFNGVYQNTDIFFKISQVLGLGMTQPPAGNYM